MNPPTLHEQYLHDHLQDPDFKALYAIARYKSHLEFLLETTRGHIEENSTPDVLLADIRTIEQFLDRISIDQHVDSHIETGELQEGEG